jgi:hypothetical protein
MVRALSHQRACASESQDAGPGFKSEPLAFAGSEPDLTRGDDPHSEAGAGPDGPDTLPVEPSCAFPFCAPSASRIWREIARTTGGHTALQICPYGRPLPRSSKCSGKPCSRRHSRSV